MSKATIFGKVRRKGTSKKTGKPYDFFEFHMAVAKRGIIGESAERKIVDGSFCDFDKLALGVYDADFDADGNLLSLKPIQGQ